jgi:hypothetical protein
LLIKVTTSSYYKTTNSISQTPKPQRTTVATKKLPAPEHIIMSPTQTALMEADISSMINDQDFMECLKTRVAHMVAAGQEDDAPQMS